MTDIMLELTNSLQKGLTFNIAHSSANFNNSNMHIIIGSVSVKTAFDFICNMWDDLNRTAAVIAATFLL